MDNPVVGRNLWLGVLVAGLVAVFACWRLPPATLGIDLRVGLMAGGLLAIVFGTLLALMNQAQVRLRRRLATGTDVIARWRVDPDTWRRFATIDAGLGAVAGALPNQLRMPDAMPATGVDIIVGRGAVQVGDDVHAVPERGAPEVLSAVLDDRRLKLSFVELRLLHPGVDRPDVHTVLRFPVADGSLRAARAAVAHFARETPGRPDFFHGRGDGSDPEDLSRCWSCGFETHKFRSRCERCGEPLQSRRWSRRYGAILVILGGVLTAGMGLLLRILLPILRDADGGGSVRFNGTPSQATAITALLGLVFAFGVLTLAYGLFQMATGRRSRIGVGLILGFAGAMVAAGLFLAR